MRLSKAVLNLAKVLLFMCENFRTHNLRFRNSLYFFILETPVMPLLNTLGRNSVNLVLHTTLEKPDPNSEGLISLKKWLLSRKHEALQIQFEQLFEQNLELVVSNFLLQSILEMRLWRFDFSQKWLLSRKHYALQIQFEQLLQQILESVLSNFLLHSILEMPGSVFFNITNLRFWTNSLN